MGTLTGLKGPPSTQLVLSPNVVPPPHPRPVIGCASRPLSYWGPIFIWHRPISSRTEPAHTEVARMGGPWRPQEEAWTVS